MCLSVALMLRYVTVPGLNFLIRYKSSFGYSLFTDNFCLILDDLVLISYFGLRRQPSPLLSLQPAALLFSHTKCSVFPVKFPQRACHLWWLSQRSRTLCSLGYIFLLRKKLWGSLALADWSVLESRPTIVRYWYRFSENLDLRSSLFLSIYGNIYEVRKALGIPHSTKKSKQTNTHTHPPPKKTPLLE